MMMTMMMMCDGRERNPEGERIGGRDGWMDGWMDKLEMDGYMDGWMDGWMDLLFPCGRFSKLLAL